MTQSQKSTISRFDDKDTICVITSYPDSDHGVRELNAVAWHAKKTLRALGKEKKVLVIAEKFGDEYSIYQDGKNVLVYRMWRRGSPMSLFAILRIIFIAPKVEHFLIQFEFNIFGGIFPVLALPFILVILKLCGKKVHFEIHQVVLDIRQLAKHINVTTPLFQHIFDTALHGFYICIGLFADTLIVLEEELKIRLGTLVKPDKIHIVPISIDKKKCMPKNKAKSLIGYKQDDFVVLVFGFVNWYKGSDWMARIGANYPDKNVKFILAGGSNPTLKDKEYYQEYYENIVNIASKSENVRLTGFVADKDISKYYSAADLVVMPYRVFMSASGPFSLALSFKKPIILSEVLRDYGKSHDFADAMTKVDLKSNEIFFPLKQKALAVIIEKLKKNPRKLLKLKHFSEELSSVRSSERVIERLLFALENTSPLPYPKTIVAAQA